jgi:putative endonuclease
MYYVYILECKDKSLYTGITTDVARRLAEHKAGSASHYTSSRGAKRIVYTERRKNRSQALKREAAIKRLTRAKKLKLTQSVKIDS